MLKKFKLIKIKTRCKPKEKKKSTHNTTRKQTKKVNTVTSTPLQSSLLKSPSTYTRNELLGNHNTLQIPNSFFAQ